MRYSVLRMVQLILSSMDSDEVSDIDDTVESLQIVDVLETCYYDVISQIEFPEHKSFFELDPSIDTSRPTLMYVPSNVTHLEWVQYEQETGTETNFEDVCRLSLHDFFERMKNLDSADSDVYQYDFLVGSETFDVRGYNDRDPQYYCSPDDYTLVFDNYQSSQGQTLISNRTKCFGSSIPAFQRDNEFVPDLDPKQFTLYFNEAKSQAFLELKQIQNPKAEQRARRGWSYSQRKKNRINTDRSYHSFTPNYGRNRSNG